MRAHQPEPAYPFADPATRFGTTPKAPKPGVSGPPPVVDAALRFTQSPVRNLDGETP